MMKRNRSQNIGIYEFDDQSVFSISQRITGIFISLVFCLVLFILGSNFVFYFISFYNFYFFYNFFTEDDVFLIEAFFMLFTVFFAVFHVLHAIFRYSWVQTFFNYGYMFYFSSTNNIFSVYYPDEDSEFHYFNSLETVMFTVYGVYMASIMIFVLAYNTYIYNILYV